MFGGLPGLFISKKFSQTAFTLFHIPVIFFLSYIPVIFNLTGTVTHTHAQALEAPKRVHSILTSEMGKINNKADSMKSKHKNKHKYRLIGWLDMLTS